MRKLLLSLLVIVIPLVLGACDTTEPVLKGINETVEVQCGSEFNLDQYLNENLKITDETDEGKVDYKLKDLEYKITCDDYVYNAETGNVETRDYGTYDVELVVKDESRNKAKLSFQLFLNPVEVEKGFYMYPDESAEGTFNVQGFCEIRNTSKQFLKLSNIKMKLMDKNGIVVYETDMPEFAPEYLSPGNSSYIMDEYGGWNIALNHEEDIADIDIDFDYDRDKKENDTTLDVGDFEINRSSDSFSATTIVMNPYDEGVEQYVILAGLYDKDGKLIGVIQSYGDTTSLAPKGKGKAKLGWLAESMVIPNKTKEAKGHAFVIRYDGE